MGGGQLVKSAHVGRGILSTLAYWVFIPAREDSKAGEPVRQPHARVDYIPQSGTKNVASVPDVSSDIGY